MLLFPHSDANSEDSRLELLADPELAKRLRKANPKFFTRSGHGSIARILALAGIVSLAAGYFIEPVVVRPPYRDREAMITTHVHRVPAVPLHIAVHHHAAPVTHVQTVVAPPRHTIVVQPELVPQLQPEKKVQRRGRPVAVAQAQPEAQARNEEQFWLKAQAEARARDRARVATRVAAAPAPAPVQAPVQAPVDTQVPTMQLPVPQPQPPVNAPTRVPGPFSGPWPLPGGGPCTPGRGPILVGGRGIAGALINAVLQNVIPVHHTRPFGRP